MSPDVFRDYLRNIEKSLATGSATEHTHRAHRVRRARLHHHPRRYARRADGVFWNSQHVSQR